MKLSLFLTPICLLFAQVAQAHHGQNFLWLEDTTLPHAGEGNALFDYEWQKRGGDDSQSYTFGSMVGLTDHGMALSFSATAGDESGATIWQSMQPTLHFAHEINDSVSVGLSIGYQIALNETNDLHVHEDVGCDPDIDLGPDAPPCAPGGSVHDHGGGHSHSALHNHRVSAGISRFIVEAQLSPEWNMVGNLFVVLPEGDDVAFGYALGFRRTISSSLSVGFESIGDLQGGGEHSVMAAIYWEPVDSLVAKVGVGTGLNDASADVLLRTAVMWNF